jgi:amino acid transporter
MQRLVDDLAPGLADRLVAALRLPGTGQKAGFVFWAVLFVGAMTLLNVRGIKWTARANQVLTAGMFLLIVFFSVDAIGYLWSHHGWAGLFSTDPYYNPKTFNLRAIGTATSLAALTYIGFDGITTLAEDVREPRRTVPLAIVLACLIIGACAWLEVYLAQRVWPDYTTFNNLDTAFFDVCKLVGGRFLFNALGLVMAVASLGSALTGQVGAARLLFGMGRDGALPSFFSRLDRRDNPAFNLWLLGVLVLAATLWLTYEAAAELINFGAFLAFMGVNLAVIREFGFRPPSGHKRHWAFDYALPALGFLFCLAIWLHLPLPAKKVGGAWCALGLLYTAIQTRGFRERPVMINFEA